jgi:S-adenosylmethionine/arginine decarboxylase-like enzyme
MTEFFDSTPELKYHGHHIMGDYIGSPLSSEETLELAPKIEQLILLLLRDIGIECVGHNFKIFDGSTNPAGIASTFTLSDSHASLHMYSNYEGKCLIAMDIFTCNLTSRSPTDLPGGHINKNIFYTMFLLAYYAVNKI